MTYKRLLAFMLGAVMTVEAVPAAVFAKEIDLSSNEVIVAEEEEAGEAKETEETVSETTAKKEKEAPKKETPETEAAEAEEKAPSVTEDKKGAEKEDKEPAQTETEESAATETKEEAESTDKEQDPAETDVKETDADKEPAVTEDKGETEKVSREPADANEEEEPALKDGEVVYESAKIAEQKDVPSKTPDNNEQLEAYFKKKTEEQVGKSRPVLRKAAPSVGSRLTGNNKIAYDCFKEKAALVAKGQLTSTAFEIPISNFGLGLENKSWTKEELGVTRLTYKASDGKTYVDPDAADAVRALVSIPIDIGPVDDALLADCPFELYWFDKTTGVLLYKVAIGAKNFNGVTKLYIAAGPTGCFYVSDDYALAPLQTDITKITRVNTAINRAAGIVNAASTKTDYSKLTYYCNQIMGLVVYDDAAAGGGKPYGDPWQLISVFDGNSKTNVVCEGYAKAFMYLCNFSTFKGDISCILATGNCGGGHMWNIVNMDDGKNYLVDVTNIDGRGTATTAYFNALFLTGYSSKVTDGYKFSGITFTYDQDCFNTYSSDQLEISDKNYNIARQVTVSGKANGNPTVDKPMAKPDELVTITPNAVKGYEVDKVTVNGEEIEGTSFYMAGVPAVVEVTYKLKQLKVGLVMEF